MIDEIASLPDVSFIDDITLDDIQAQMVADYLERYEQLTGKSATMARADPVSLILYACSIQIFHAMLYVDRAGKQDLLKYSYGGFLDNLAALKGIAREPAKPAAVTMRFTLSDVRPEAVAIPDGTRVSNGEIYFATDEYAEIPAGETTIDVVATCQDPGTEGNHILAGEINILVDPIAYVASAVNIEESTGGADIEDDDTLAGRIYIAPSKYSVAGPEEAYRYWVQTFNASILDAYIGSENPGEVLVEFILDGGVLPSTALCQQLADYLMDENIRPLTDKVVVRVPETVDYSVGVTYYINKSDTSKAATIQSAVSAAVSDYITWQQSRIGRDINPSKLIAMMEEAGAKRVEVASPAFQAIPDTSIAKVSATTVTYGGIEND